IRTAAAIAVVFPTLFALGVVMISLASSSTDLTKILFGNLLAIRSLDLWITVGIGAAVLTVVALFYRPLHASTFDPTWAAAYGLPISSLHYLLMLLLTLVGRASWRDEG